jgi:4-amino-4-deoxy-L-arabinose transferase-like glycosyltransferase
MNYDILQKHKSRVYLVAAVLIFSILYLPSLTSLPYLDGNIFFVKSVLFYQGGFEEMFAHFNSIHPPLKQILTFFFFSIFGVNTYVDIFLGWVLGVFSIFFVYLLLMNIADKKSTIYGSLFWSINPLFISTSFFALNDFVLTFFVVSSVYFYSKERVFISSLLASLGVLTKETGILLPISFVISEISQLLIARRRLTVITAFINVLNFSLPFIVLYGWISYMDSLGKGVWGDWNFSEVATKGSFYTIYHNLVTLGFLNKYAYQNWLQVLFLNFNWVYWLVILVSISFYLYKYQRLTMRGVAKLLKNKTHLSLIIFFVLYMLIVLSFQTYTIPRYHLKADFILVVYTSISLSWLVRYNKLAHLVVLIVFLVSIIRLFYSIDPISKFLWGRTTIVGEEVYDLGSKLSGNDGITYNFQYLSIVKRRTHFIKQGGENGVVSPEECSRIIADPNNDYKTFRFIGINVKPCKRPLPYR